MPCTRVVWFLFLFVQVAIYLIALLLGANGAFLASSANTASVPSLTAAEGISLNLGCILAVTLLFVPKWLQIRNDKTGQISATGHNPSTATAAEHPNVLHRTSSKQIQVQAQGHAQAQAQALAQTASRLRTQGSSSSSNNIGRDDGQQQQQQQQAALTSHPSLRRVNSARASSTADRATAAATASNSTPSDGTAPASAADNHAASATSTTGVVTDAATAAAIQRQRQAMRSRELRSRSSRISPLDT